MKDKNKEEKEGNRDEYKSTGKLENFAKEKTLTPPDSPTTSTS